MSMILDALRRSRAETGEGASVPGIDTDHAIVAESISRSSASRGLVLLLLSVVAALLIVVLVMAWYVWIRPTGTFGEQANGGAAVAATQKEPMGDRATPEQGSAARPSLEASIAPPTAPEPARLEQAAPDQAAAGPAKDVVNQDRASSSQGLAKQNPAAVLPAAAADVAALYARPQGMQPAQTQSEGGPGRASETGANGVQAPDGSVNSIRAQVADAAAQADGGEASSRGDVSAAAEEVIDVEEVLRRAQTALGESPLEPHPAPLLENLSQQVKDNIPSIMYTRHVWGDDRTAEVMLNGQSLRVGQRHQGFVVKEILSDSVVLSWGGTDFRLRALNSWINL